MSNIKTFNDLSNKNDMSDLHDMSDLNAMLSFFKKINDSKKIITDDINTKQENNSDTKRANTPPVEQTVTQTEATEMENVNAPKEQDLSSYTTYDSSKTKNAVLARLDPQTLPVKKKLNPREKALLAIKNGKLSHSRSIESIVNDRKELEKAKPYEFVNKSIVTNQVLSNCIVRSFLFLELVNTHEAKPSFVNMYVKMYNYDSKICGGNRFELFNHVDDKKTNEYMMNLFKLLDTVFGEEFKTKFFRIEFQEFNKFNNPLYHTFPIFVGIICAYKNIKPDDLLGGLTAFMGIVSEAGIVRKIGNLQDAFKVYEQFKGIKNIVCSMDNYIEKVHMTSVIAATKWLNVHCIFNIDHLLTFLKIKSSFTFTEEQIFKMLN